MDWALAIERNREPLLRIVTTLFAMIGLTGTGAVERLSRPVYRAVLGVLRPAEAAVRRLIIVAARGLVVKPSPFRPAPAGLAIAGRGQGRMSFQLFRCPAPAFRMGPSPPGPKLWAWPPHPFHRCRFRSQDSVCSASLLPKPAVLEPASEEEDDTVNARPLCRRLAAIKRALEDLPRQARRFARWRARPIEARRPRRATPLRRGSPPGPQKANSRGR